LRITLRKDPGMNLVGRNKRNTGAPVSRAWLRHVLASMLSARLPASAHMHKVITAGRAGLGPCRRRARRAARRTRGRTAAAARPSKHWRRLPRALRRRPRAPLQAPHQTLCWSANATRAASSSAPAAAHAVRTRTHCLRCMRQQIVNLLMQGTCSSGPRYCSHRCPLAASRVLGSDGASEHGPAHPCTCMMQSCWCGEVTGRPAALAGAEQRWGGSDPQAAWSNGQAAGAARAALAANINVCNALHEEAPAGQRAGGAADAPPQQARSRAPLTRTPVCCWRRRHCAASAPARSRPTTPLHGPACALHDLTV